MKELILIIALALVSTGAWGANSYAIGDGTSIDCDSVYPFSSKTSTHSITSSDSKEFQRYFSWVIGYISATNHYRGTSSNRGSVFGNNEKERYDFILVQLAQYCLGHPEGSLADAAEAVAEELFKKEESQ